MSDSTPQPIPDGLPDVPPPPAPQPPPAKISAKDPSWWRLGSVPFLVLIMVAAAADLAMPRSQGWGLGTGIGCFLAVNALLLLRKDFTRGEYWFLQGLACINMLALLCSGLFINWVTSLVIPFIVVMIPTRQNYVEVNTPYRTWWGYWIARRQTEDNKGRFTALRAILPLLICILIGLVAFVVFLCIFATGNPLVELVWNTLVDWWNKLVEFLHISWDFWVHVSYWLLGFLWFGIYCFNRHTPFPSTTAAPAEAEAPSTGSTLLPHLPLCILIGINAAFAVATSTDIAFLWLGNVPEGISQTEYLHEGASSITWAAVLAAGVLVLLFRRNGTARSSKAGRFFGFLLVVQTALLAISVYMRLYHQIEDFGFTVRRIQAAEAMLLGLASLIILILYMSGSGSFWQHAKICLGTIALMLLAFFSYSPARLAGNLNLMFLSSHPHWSFDSNDFRIGRFSVEDNLTFAEYVYNKGKANCDNQSFSRLSEDRLKSAALNVEQRATNGSWISFNLSIKEDLPAAERILGRPITIKLTEPED